MDGCTVIKLGGSLLKNASPDLDDQVGRLVQFISSDVLIVVGGGAAADMVRRWDKEFSLGEQVSHSIAVYAMGMCSRLLAAILKNAELANSVDACQRLWSQSKIAIADPQLLIDQLQPAAQSPIEEVWAFTSDSVAAWIAREIHANQIVFTKSISLADAGHCENPVDSCLGCIRDVPPMYWCNLRGDTLSVEEFSLPIRSNGSG